MNWKDAIVIYAKALSQNFIVANKIVKNNLNHYGSSPIRESNRRPNEYEASVMSNRPRSLMDVFLILVNTALNLLWRISTPTVKPEFWFGETYPWCSCRRIHPTTAARGALSLRYIGSFFDAIFQVQSCLFLFALLSSRLGMNINLFRRAAACWTAFLLFFEF